MFIHSCKNVKSVDNLFKWYKKTFTVLPGMLLIIIKVIISKIIYFILIHNIVILKYVVESRLLYSQN